MTSALRRRLVLPLIATLAAVGIGSPARADHHCAAIYRVTATWDFDGQTGFIADVLVSNMSATPTAGWRVTLRFRNPDLVVVNSAWNAVLLPPEGPPYELGNMSFNGVLPPGGQTTAGFQAAGPARRGDVLRIGCTPR